MEKVGKFEKISYEAFEKFLEDSFGLETEEIKQAYDELLLPTRATSGSAGYDFHVPLDLTIAAKESVIIPSGMRCQMVEGWVLQIFPRSSLGFKYNLQLDNTVGIIDSDYYYADNEGHIRSKVTNHSDKELVLKANDRFCQGIFIPFGITSDDEATTVRTGGLGSTNK